MARNSLSSVVLAVLFVGGGLLVFGGAWFWLSQEVSETEENASEAEEHEAIESASHSEAEHEEAELALHMSQLQRWTHKATLALDARNPELADFYLHEMEESIETIQTEAPTYEGHAIADLTESMLVPSVEALDAVLEDRDWDAVDERLDQLAQSCNQCHQATDHGFVRVDLEEVPNPYPQDFSPREK